MSFWINWATLSILFPTNILIMSCFVEKVSSSFNQASNFWKDCLLLTSYTARNNTILDYQYTTFLSCGLWTSTAHCFVFAHQNYGNSLYKWNILTAKNTNQINNYRNKSIHSSMIFKGNNKFIHFNTNPWSFRCTLNCIYQITSSTFLCT